MYFRIRSVADYELELTRRYAEYKRHVAPQRTAAQRQRAYFPGVWRAKTVSWPARPPWRLAVTSSPIEPTTRTSRRCRPGCFARRRRRGNSTGSSFLARCHARTTCRRSASRTMAKPSCARWPPRRSIRATWLWSTPRRRRHSLIAGNDLTADVRFAVDDPEHVVLETVAPERGFVFLADQYFPGWSAQVNGQDTPIMLADHTFFVWWSAEGPVRIDFTTGRAWCGSAS